MTQPQVAVLDYGSGNVHSAVKALTKAGAKTVLTRDPDVIMSVDGLVVPGVGSFSAVARQLRRVRGDELISRRIAREQPVFGICVGQQVMFESGTEHGEETLGLGHLPGTVTRLKAPILPHMGWAEVSVADGSTLFQGLASEFFYFVHSYAATTWKTSPEGTASNSKVTWAFHGEPFIAAVEQGPLSTTQFHPEKSGDAGIALLSNWTKSITI